MPPRLAGSASGSKPPERVSEFSATGRNPASEAAFREADDGLRTRDLRLGKPTLYQLSYVRAERRF